MVVKQRMKYKRGKEGRRRMQQEETPNVKFLHAHQYKEGKGSLKVTELVKGKKGDAGMA